MPKLRYKMPKLRQKTKGHGPKPVALPILDCATGLVPARSTRRRLSRRCSGQARQRQGNYSQRHHARR